MMRLFALVVVSLLVVTTVQAANELAGTWRSQTGNSVSYWELKPRGNDVYDAQEYGQGNVKGTVRLKDGTLEIRYVAGNTSGVYSWTLQGGNGTGSLNIQTKGEDPVFFPNSSIRFIGK